VSVLGRIFTKVAVCAFDKSKASISIAGRKVVTEVWVGDTVSRVLVGATTLEMMGLKVDPRTGRLEPSPLLLYHLTTNSRSPDTITCRIVIGV